MKLLCMYAVFSNLLSLHLSLVQIFSSIPCTRVSTWNISCL
jgi:hypothetical protein